MKKILLPFFAAFIAMSLSVSSFSPALGNQEGGQQGERMEMEIPTAGGWIGVDFIETEYFATSLLTVANARGDSNYDDWRTIICDSADDPKCQVAGYYYDVTSIFSPCTQQIKINCIESLRATMPDGKVIEGSVKRLWNPSGEYKGDELLGIPDGGQSSTWILKDSNASGSEEYLVFAGVRGGMPVPSVNSLTTSNEKFFGQLFANIQPVREISGNFMSPKMTLVPRGNGGVGVGGGLAFRQGCFMNDEVTCAQRAPFPLDVTYELKMRFDHQISPWLNGRVVDPSISVQTIDAKKSLLTISAKAMKVPEVGGYIKWSETPSWMKAKYPSGTGGTSNSPDGFTTKDLDNRILKVGAGSAGEYAIKEFKDWIPFLQDKPFAMKTYWNVKGIRDAASRTMQECAKNKFAGMVSSNAAVYSSGAPSWNAERETLEYTVGAPHYDLEGKLLTGQYVLSMRSDVARCIYGFTSAPISARVEIASEDGTPNVVTTVINENRETGMLTLAASGFHYSTPQLSVKLTQEKSPTPTNSPSATIKPAPINKSLVCVKGKLSKIVKGKNPKCPNGFKKKP